MVKEIYIRDEKDPYFEYGVIDYSNEIESIISQLRMIMGTRKGEVLGDTGFGIDLDRLVFGTKKTGDEIMSELNELIRDYLYHGPNTSVNCEIEFGDSGHGYDYAVIDVYINGNKAVGFLVDENER